MIGAFTFLIGRTVRNRLAGQARRLKQPKYALAAIVGLLYFWGVYFRPGSGYRQGTPVFTPQVGAFIPLLLLVYLAWAWIFGADKTALAFSEAEVSFLFPAPVTRRQLLGFKLARAQVQILLTSVLWVALFHKGAEQLPAALRVTGFWVFLSTLNLHRLGVALAHSASVQHGVRGIRRNLVAIIVLGTIIAVTGWGLWQAGNVAWAMPGKREALRYLSDAMTTGPVAVALWPIRAVVRLAFAANAREWFTNAPAALLVLGVNLWWVARADHAFEEAAAESSALQARRLEALRARRTGGVAATRTVKVQRTLPLAPIGTPWFAVVWKNLMSLMRSGGLRSMMWPGGIAIAAALAFSGRSTAAEETVIAGSLVTGLMIAFFAPVFTRNDLRADLLHLPMLKTLPLTGQQIVTAQILGGALPVTAAQLLLVTAVALANGTMHPPDASPSWLMDALVVSSPLVLLAFNTANFSIHNAMALLFPGWIKLGSGGPGGIETMGLGILTFLALGIALLLLLLVPGAVGAGLYFGIGAQQFGALAAALNAGALILGFEVWLLTRVLGGSFQRVEPTQVA